MEFDHACKARNSELEIPTLKPGVKAEPCDRTDYSAPSSPAQAYDLNQYRMASPGVYRVDQAAGRGSNYPRGSAFTLGAFGETCLLASDYHVPKGPDGKALPGLIIQDRNGNRAGAQVRSWDPATDTSILATPLSSVKECPALPLAESSSSLQIGVDRMVAIGHPSGSKLQFISGGTVENKGRTHVEIDSKGKANPWAEGKTVEAVAQVIGGMSGAPAFHDGKVYGNIQGMQGNARMIITPVEDILALRDKTLAATVKNGGSCDMDDARKEIAARSKNNDIISVTYTDRRSPATLHYEFNYGQGLTISEKDKTCTWSATLLDKK